MQSNIQPKGNVNLPREWAVFGSIGAGFGTTKDCLFPSHWALFGPLKKNDPEPDFAGMTDIPKELAVSDKRVVARNVAFPGGRLDLGALMGGKEEGKTTYLLAVVEVKKSMEIALGAGADWWMKWWVNGEVVCDTKATGNVKHPPSIFDHRFTARLKAGRNLIAVKVVSGSASFVLAAGRHFSEPDFGGMVGPPAKLVVAGQRLNARKATFDADGRLDLGALLECRGEGQTAYLMACLESDKAREVWFGAGADWRMKWWVNGETVCDTLATGNEDRPPTALDHRFMARLKPGKNVLAVKVVSSASGFGLTTSGPSERRRVTEMNDLTDVNAWKKCSGYYSDSNHFNLQKEKAGFVIESETTLPEGPGVMSYGVISTRERHGAPGLKGTLIFEVDFVDYTNNGEYLNKYMSAIGQASDHEDPFFGNYLMGWGITIGNRKGFVGGMDDGDRQRAVQFHFDGYSKWGFGSCMNRQISTQDQQKYPRFTQTELMAYLADYFSGKETYEDAVRRAAPYRSMNDATVLSARHYPLDEGATGSPGLIRGRSWGHRYGIMLSNDGNTFSWLLDGKVMDSCDITGYFSSSTDDFAEGVYISIGGGAGFRKNLWRFANPRLTVKPAKETTMGTRFGVNSFLGNIAHSEIRGAEGGVKPAAEDRTHYLDALKDLGVDIIREQFSWAEIEPERGKGYRWEAHDDLARKASERGIEIVALQYPFPEWATGRAATPPTQPFRFMYDLPGREFEPDFRRFVRALIARYCGHGPEALPLKIPVRTWIFGNEQDIHFNQPGARNVSSDDYAFWLKAFYEEVKAADPDATVAASGLGRTIELKDDRFWGSVWKGRDSNGVGLAYFDRVLDSANLQGPAYPYFDIQPFHGYVGFYEKDKSPAENAAASLRELSESPRNIASRLRARKIDAALWLTETGALEFSPKDQPAAAIMAVVHGASTGVPLVILHGLWDIPGNDNGLLENTPSGQVPVRKSLFTAYQTLIRLIGRNESVQCMAPGRYRALLPGGKAVYIFWTLDPAQSKVDFLHGPIRVTNLQGNHQEIDAAMLTLSDQPCFVEQLNQSETGGQ